MVKPVAGLRAGVLRPGYIFSLFAVMALILGTFAFYGLRQSRIAMLDTMEKGALSLAEAVARAEENALRAEENAEALLIDRLFTAARLVRELEQRADVDSELFKHIAQENDLEQLDLLDSQGQLLASSGDLEEGERLLWAAEMPVLEAEGELLFEQEGPVFTAAVARERGGGVLARGMADNLLALRRSSGAGRLVQEIGGGEGVVYMVWQDLLGVLAASRGVEIIDPIEGDAFLEQVLSGNKSAARMVQYEGDTIFEKVIPFRPVGSPAGLLRVGLSLDAFREQEQRGRLQFVALVALLLVLGLVGAGAVTVRQNNALIAAAYTRIQTYSSRVLAQMADAVVAVDVGAERGRVQIFNEAAVQLFGVAESEALGRPLEAIWSGELVERVLGNGRELQSESCLWRAADGSTRDLSVSASLVRGADETIETAVFIIQDLSVKRALEADLQRRDRLASMGALASGVAHEVRNPLNAISVIVQRLRREFEPREDAEDYARLTAVVGDEVKRVDRIIRQFLELARPPQLERQQVELGELLERAAQVSEPGAVAKGLFFQRNFAVSGEIWVDPDQMQQALLNLLGNAVEATERGFVRLGAGDAGDDAIEITVEDTGKGITEGALERIFDLYYTTKAEGTGLGLSLVHRIVSEHGGRLEVDSEEGRGTRFSLVLPRGISNGG
ncbi:MAG: two-component system sensor histidine kinase NtrB [Candidatus Latescibacterota bacterium]|jgi:two-component system sensor histidine kinase HydH